MNKDSKKIGKNIALAALSQIPVVSAFSKFIEDFVQDGWQERIDLWKEEVVKRLAQLDKEIEQKIRETSNFASILATAQRGALEDMEEDKVALYANAFINAIKNERMEDTKKHIFLNMLMEFSILHIRILTDLKAFEDEKIKGKTFSVTDNKPSFLDYLSDDIRKNVFFHSILKNFYDNGMIYADRRLNLDIGIDDIEPLGLTPLGHEFLAFISEQEKTND